MNWHYETIICPECGKIQPAVVEHSWPFYSYVHNCNKCGYTIMESEWITELPDPCCRVVSRMRGVVKGKRWTRDVTYFNATKTINYWRVASIFFKKKKKRWHSQARRTRWHIFEQLFHNDDLPF